MKTLISHASYFNNMESAGSYTPYFLYCLTLKMKNLWAFRNIGNSLPRTLHNNPEDLNLNNATWWTSDLIVYSVILFTLFVTANGIKCVTCFSTNNNQTATAMTNDLHLDWQVTKIIESTGKLFRVWNSLTCKQELSQQLKSLVYQIYIYQSRACPSLSCCVGKYLLIC
jgi:hypothetical protein